jgi:hypothetical protein
MKSERTRHVYPALLAMMALTSLLAGCAATDVVAKYAASSFEIMARAMDASIEESYLVIRSPTEDLFALAQDLSGNVDAFLSVDAAPFLATGLDPARLPAGPESSWAVEDGRLVGRFDLAPSGNAVGGDPKALMAALASAARGKIGYHAQMGHYGVMLDNNAMVEWAADARKNDKDWVLIIDPELVVAAEGNPAAVEGWILAMVPVDGPDGKMVEVQKLLRPFDIIK